MSTIIPIFIPQTPATCPKCGKPENILEVCGHCQYVYRRPVHPVRDLVVMVVSVLGGCLIFAFGFMVVLEWLSSRNNASLTEVAMGYIRWLLSKRVL